MQGTALFLIVFGIFFAMPAHAQFRDVEPISFTIQPASPRPYDTIIITPKSNLLNLAASTITVSVNGTVLYEGSGGAPIQTTLGASGSSTVIRMTAVSGGETYEKEMTITPTDVALVVEPMSVTPLWYEGAALVAPEGRLRVIAIPDIRTAPNTRIPAEQLSYTWQIGDKTLSAESGIGRSVLTATAAPRYRDAQVSVLVSTVDGAHSARASVTIAAASPEVLVYENDPLLGVNFAHALSGTRTLLGDEETYRVEGFHFASRPTFSWNLNGDSAGATNALTVRAVSGGGRASIEAVGAYANEQAEAAFTLLFGTERRSLFGF